MAGSGGRMRPLDHQLPGISHRTKLEMSADEALDNSVCSHTGIQCLVALARHHGSDLSAGRLVHEHALTNEPDAAHLAVIAESVGLKARAVTFKWRDLAGLEDAFPVIAI